MGIEIWKYMIEVVYNTRSIISSSRLPGQGMAEPVEAEEAMQNVAVRATSAESFPHWSGRRGCSQEKKWQWWRYDRPP
ncbi:hypothetical protein SESBI_49763 [Sesbania bispinosa]|nr:hypothetical protein SESBI_49763 [Sesbania bispinosa]